MTKSSQYRLFAKSLTDWNKFDNSRIMPWKGEKDPYKIWLSEIILQQTRVSQGLDYYNRFIEKFPTVHHLAKAPENQIFKLWEGLGYYTRCKNLIISAKFISKELRGKFPDNYNDIIQLKGIGPYTAAAIASFAFDLPYAVVDGNVFRVLSRYFGIATAIDSVEGKLIFTELANSLLDKNQPGVYNQALMDFGAVVCKPQLPQCDTCPLLQGCRAFKTNNVLQLPVKEKSIVKKDRWFFFLIIEFNKKIYIRKREAKDIWENLFEFVAIEKNKDVNVKNKKDVNAILKGTDIRLTDFRIVDISDEKKQLLTHQTIRGQFIYIITDTKPEITSYKAVPKPEIKKFPFPKFITSYLKDKNVSLNLF